MRRVRETDLRVGRSSECRESVEGCTSVTFWMVAVRSEVPPPPLQNETHHAVTRGRSDGITPSDLTSSAKPGEGEMTNSAPKVTIYRHFPSFLGFANTRVESPRTASDRYPGVVS